MDADLINSRFFHEQFQHLYKTHVQHLFNLRKDHPDQFKAGISALLQSLVHSTAVVGGYWGAYAGKNEEAVQFVLKSLEKDLRIQMAETIKKLTELERIKDEKNNGGNLLDGDDDLRM